MRTLCKMAISALTVAGCCFTASCGAVAPERPAMLGNFLCMTPDDSTAITNDVNGDLMYTEMVASNGAVVTPIISPDGNTYLPMRYICDMTGLKEGDENEELADGEFRYVSCGSDGVSAVEINYGGNYYSYNIGDTFEYTASDGTEREVGIYNVDGSIYMPMRYIAEITDSQALWESFYGRVVFIGHGVNAEDYIDENNRILRSKQVRLEFDFFENNLAASPLYLKTDGVTVSNLAHEVDNGEGIHSVTRGGNIIYYINAKGVIMARTEGADDDGSVVFKDSDGKHVDVTASTAFVIKNKLYGIKTDDPVDGSGYLFSADLDGENFTYLTDKKVYNLIAKKDMVDYYMFYCEADAKSNIHMIREKTMDDYAMEITTHERENLIENVVQLAVGSEYIYYLSEDGTFNVVSLEFRPQHIEIQRLYADRRQIFTETDDGESFANAKAMNFDDINDILYVAFNDGSLYYYSKDCGTFLRLTEDASVTEAFSLFSNFSFDDGFAGLGTGKLTWQNVHYEDGEIVLD